MYRLCWNHRKTCRPPPPVTCCLCTFYLRTTCISVLHHIGSSLVIDLFSVLKRVNYFMFAKGMSWSHVQVAFLHSCPCKTSQIFALMCDLHMRRCSSFNGMFASTRNRHVAAIQMWLHCTAESRMHANLSHIKMCFTYGAPKIGIFLVGVTFCSLSEEPVCLRRWPGWNTEKLKQLE